MEQTPPWKSPQPIELRRGTKWLLFGFASIALLLFIGLVGGALYIAPLVRSLPPARIAGSPVPPDQPGLHHSFPPEFVGGGRPLSKAEAQALVNQALSKVENLRLWHVCAAELRASAEVHRSLAALPDDIQWHQTPAERTFFIATADSYERAARLAEVDRIPCFGPYERHGISFRVDDYGVPREVLLSDRQVMHQLNTMEAYRLEGACVTAMQQQRAIIDELPASAMIDADRLINLIVYDAAIKLLRQFPETNC